MEAARALAAEPLPPGEAEGDASASLSGSLRQPKGASTAGATGDHHATSLDCRETITRRGSEVC